MPDLDKPAQVTNNGLRLEIRLQPNACKAKVENVSFEDDGSCYLKVRVTEVPEKVKPILD